MNLSSLHESRMFIAVPLYRIVEKMSPVNTLTVYFFTIWFNITVL